jgi:hypothetical protein
MRIALVVGAALAFAPALALADQNQAGQGQTQNQMDQNQMNQRQMNPNQMNPNQMGQTQNQMGQTQNQMGQNQPAQPDVTAQKLLPKDAKLVGSVESTDIRAFPEQVGTKSPQSAGIAKEEVVGVGGIDRVWMTKQPYRQAVSQLDQKLKGEGIQPIAKTTTQSSTAWNMRMPDGHVANVVVRNTQPTTIEAVQASVVTGTVTNPSNRQP